MIDSRITLSVVVPVYREERNAPEFLKRITPILSSVVDSHEIIFSMDPSPDRTEDVILEARRLNDSVKLLKFSRRVGQPMATLAGLQYASGDAVVVMDVDMQDPPELIVEMVQKWREGFDVVYAQRRNREGEPWIRKVVAAAAYKVIERIAEVKIPPNTGDFRLMSRRVVREINQLKECHGFLRGLVALVGFRQTSVVFDRPARFSGETNYPIIGSIKIGLNGLLCFSTAALKLSSVLGFFIAGGAILLALVYLVLKIIGFPIAWGNPTLVILVAFLGGVQLVSVGILGEYIARIYEEVRMRPKFIIDQAHGFEAPSPGGKPGPATF